ncbi:unnamed protein product [Rhodiola kirilowii]
MKNCWWQSLNNMLPVQTAMTFNRQALPHRRVMEVKK